MRDVIVKASAGLCTIVAMKTPRPALPSRASKLVIRGDSACQRHPTNQRMDD